MNTEIQVGPLYRVVDTRLSIFCNASGYPSDKRTEFQFRMSRPSRPDFSVNIISSEEPDFSYASHGKRVATKDIVLMHQGQSDVLFVIEKLLKEDEGEYECISVSKETVLDGTFSAKTIVKGKPLLYFLMFPHGCDGQMSELFQSSSVMFCCSDR